MLAPMPWVTAILVTVAATIFLLQQLCPCCISACTQQVPGQLEHAYSDGMDENFSPMYVVYNGAVGALTEKPLIVDQVG